MVATSRKIAGYAVDLLTLLVVRKPTRKQRRRALRNAIYASYDRAGNDPEFQAEMRALDEEFDATVGDGLDEETPAILHASAATHMMRCIPDEGVSPSGEDKAVQEGTGAEAGAAA